MAVPLLDLKRQFAAIREDVRTRLDEVIEEQSFILGPPVEELETAIADFVGVEHAVGLASGTDALLLPLKTLALRPGDEVITSAFTFFACAGAIHNAGGRPVFVDIEPDTFNLDPARVERAITARTRAIIPVHLFGQMADMAPLRELADRHGLLLLEDAAQAIGARQRQRAGSDVPSGLERQPPSKVRQGMGGVPAPGSGAGQRDSREWRGVGTLGHCAAISFFPSKNLGAFGDAGMVVTRDAELAARLRRLRVHGEFQKYLHEEVGTNARLDALQAAVLLAKLPHLAAWTAARRAHATWYNERLGALEAAGYVRRPVVRPENECVYNQYTLRARERDRLRDHLVACGIGCAVYYPIPLHLQPCFRYLEYGAGDFPESERAAAEVISLPVFPELTEAEREEVAAAVEDFYG